MYGGPDKLPFQGFVTQRARVRRYHRKMITVGRFLFMVMPRLRGQRCYSILLQGLWMELIIPKLKMMRRAGGRRRRTRSECRHCCNEIRLVCIQMTWNYVQFFPPDPSFSPLILWLRDDGTLRRRAIWTPHVDPNPHLSVFSAVERNCLCSGQRRNYYCFSVPTTTCKLESVWWFVVGVDILDMKRISSQTVWRLFQWRTDAGGGKSTRANDAEFIGHGLCIHIVAGVRINLHWRW